MGTYQLFYTIWPLPSRHSWLHANQAVCPTSSCPVLLPKQSPSFICILFTYPQCWPFLRLFFWKGFSVFPSTPPGLELKIACHPLCPHQLPQALNWRSPVTLCTAALEPPTCNSLLKCIPFYLALWFLMWSGFPSQSRARIIHLCSHQLYEGELSTSWVPGTKQGALTRVGDTVLPPGVSVPTGEQKPSTA